MRQKQSRQAETIIRRFGNAYELAEAIGVTPATVYRWTYPRSRGGTNGYIPHDHHEPIRQAAQKARIRLKPTDWYPPEEVLSL